MSIINDIENILPIYKVKKCGFHSIPKLIFCYIDYLGALLFGTNSTNNAVKYVDTYFNKEYQEVSSILYEMWRHGTIHEYDPNVLKDGTLMLGWLTNISDEKADMVGHLKVFVSKNDDNKLSIRINMNRLTGDLILSIDKFIIDLNNNNELYERVNENHLRLLSFQDIYDIKNPTTKHNVQKYFLNIIEKISGRLDEKGNVIKT